MELHHRIMTIEGTIGRARTVDTCLLVWEVRRVTKLKVIIGVNQRQKGDSSEEVVRVGEVVVRLRELKTKVDRRGVPVEEDNLNLGLKVLRPVEKEVPGTRVYIRKYSTTMDDMIWARNGLVATVTRGEAVPVIQRRIVDLISLRSFLAFSYRIGRHGIRLCFLRADSGTIEKERLDFAWILIAKSALEVIKRKESLKVDDVIVEVQIMEEWGYALCEDACLLDEESEEVASHDDNAVEHGEMEASQ
ncbi:hypothetical protein TSUD_280640 [Trifolium subterraneum]|uniref:DUF4283 domain-containing protein n=1 Tax=Trifolium subterraneum TaxID=3900 RepID=A0A2Z6NUN0_TRISU|nr:hypothetical protein TSUD_280640 [Trifolium subterraneum]